MVGVRGAVVSFCMLIKRHYLGVRARLGRLDQILTALPQTAPKKALELQKKKPTAVLLVGGFSGLGIHALLTIMRLFPRYFVNVVFMSVGVVDSLMMVSSAWMPRPEKPPTSSTAVGFFFCSSSAFFGAVWGSAVRIWSRRPRRARTPR